MTIGEASPDMAAALHALHRAAFPTPAEADLVDRLNADGDAVLSLVARERGGIIGHVLFSRMRAPFRALGLGPIAVDVRARRAGIAATLIRYGIERARTASWDAVFVLGDPAYYRRFGFDAEAAAAFENRYAGPNLMALVLSERVAAHKGPRVEYAPAFDRFTE